PRFSSHSHAHPPHHTNNHPPPLRGPLDLVHPSNGKHRQPASPAPHPRRPPQQALAAHPGSAHLAPAQPMPAPLPRGAADRAVIMVAGRVAGVRRAGRVHVDVQRPGRIERGVACAERAECGRAVHVFRGRDGDSAG
ncbi:MAG: hypothetical protein LQ341_007683, partial [Variospora aurantia]